MFGYHKAHREKKRAKKAAEDTANKQKQFEAEEPERLQKQRDYEQTQARTRAEESAADRKRGREEGRAYAEELLSRDVQGLAPGHKNAMQYEANKQIQRQMQSANRRLLGDQASHGIVGKGGVGYAQQRDLERLGNEAYGQAYRDLEKLDYDTALKNRAAMFNIEQGEAAQNALDKQLAMDELKYEEERRRNRNYENQFNRLFSRV